ncbi:MAG: M28 family peptidase [Planctomycetes bacterium]|nr:M28 family peptidase [Planctomycetota bacterium]
MIQLALLCTATASLVQSVSGPPAERRVPVVVEHEGEAQLIERIARAGELWHDAGTFAVGALTRADVAALNERGIAVTELAALGAEDPLFLVDLAHADVSADVDSAGRIHFRKDRLALVGVPVDLDEYPESLRPGRTCHAGHTAIARRAILPAAPPPPGSPLAAMAASLSAGPLLAPAGGVAALLGADPRIQTLVNSVSKANLQATTQLFATSWTNRDSRNLANFGAGRAQLVARLQALGYAPTTHTWDAQHGANVVVDIPGVRYPNRFVVFGAHFDTRNYSSGTSASAPGADDNTSGSMGVLEIARVLALAGPFENSIRLVWFSGEEYGLLGSAAQAQQLVAQGREVVGMLNLDMIAYRAAGDTRDADLCVNNTSGLLTSFCLQTAPLYVPNWTAKTGILAAGSSDHASFNALGFPAAFFFEDLQQYFSQIHTPSDAYPASTNDFDLAHMITSGVVACGATLAEPVDMTISHMPLPNTTDATGPYLVSATITSSNGATVTGATLHYSGDLGLSWHSRAMSASGSIWSASLPTFGSPLEVWYWIEATDSSGANEVSPEGQGAGVPPHKFFVGTRTILYATQFEEATHNGWTSGAIAGQNDWQRWQPGGLSGDPGAAFSGNRCWGNDLAGSLGWYGDYSNSSHCWLRSPPIDCSLATRVQLEFRRWLTVESALHDKARIKVNGTLVWSNSAAADHVDTSWVPVSLDISALAAGNPAVQVEFSLQSDAGIAFGGWNIDDLRLVETTPGTFNCPLPVVYCTAKTNSQGCTPAIAALGSASLSAPAPFLLTATQLLNQRSGLLFYGYSAAATAFAGGVKCTASPVLRVGLPSSGGNVGPDDCSGTFAYDFNSRIQGGVDQALSIGVDVYAQFWYRDSASTGGIGITDAVRFRVCP